jgi:hypothetical protein
MSTKLRNSVCLTSILTLLAAGVANAQGPVGTRASGMAGAFVAVADDASAVYWNPAGVATGALLSAVIDIGGARPSTPQSQVIAAEEDRTSMVGVSATSIGVAYYRFPTYGIASVDPAVTGSQSREEVRTSVHAITTFTAGVSLVQSLTEHIVIGVTPKFMRGEDASSEFDADAGVMLSASRFRLGLIGRNLTTPTFESDATAVSLDREVRVGGAWGSGWTGVSRVILSVDADVMTRVTPSGDRRDVAGGAETWWFSQRFGLRAGVRRSTIGDARPAAAAGISAGLRPGMLLEAHLLRGQDDERSWSVGARMTF